ncbi:MAG: DUF3899 domain-containing protein [Clostridiales bacterium]|nr:DUF3899 domain-containing protein [Clostridiales bacterium]
MKKDEKENLTTTEIPETPETPQASPANFKKSKNRRWLPYVITAAVLAALTLLIAWAFGGYNHAETWVIICYWGDSFAIPGAVCFGFGILVWASNGGAFDIFAYGGRIFVRMFFKKDVIDRKYRTYYDYRESRKDKSRSFWFMIIVGGAYLTVGAVLLIVGRQLMPEYMH